MKTIFTLVLCMCLGFMSAQNAMFVHTANAGNISADASYIDHPDLNGNPSAEILVSHSWNPPGSTGVYNDNNTGVFYSNAQNKWGVYNESGASMVVGSSYNIYIGNGDVVLHIADLANQAANPVYSIINHPDLNGNPNARIVLTTYFDPNGLRNDHTYAVWYNGATDRWNIFPEDLSNLPLDTAFFMGIPDGNVAVATHRADAGNISGNYTIIEHPLLNNNPNAVFVYTHNWGISGGSGNVVLDHITGAWYTGTNWAIYTEDSTSMPEDAEFDLMIYDPSLGVEDETIEGLSYHPNPVKDLINISANSAINKVTVFDILGRQVMLQDGTINSMKLDMSTLTSGNYLAKVEAGDAVQVIKLIKQ
ncbi:MAG: T9SS type A sorting domain-containing protein [Flavobacteriaceae bacterium]|nr:T9SS type A sorting domain-containing protein [Flavobacteriaceae bacterium]